MLMCVYTYDLVRRQGRFSVECRETGETVYRLPDALKRHIHTRRVFARLLADLNTVDFTDEQKIPRALSAFETSLYS